MLTRGLILLVFVSAATAFAAPVPKSVKAKAAKMDTSRFKLDYKNVPFQKVLEDFAEGTGLEWVGERPQLGTITLHPNRVYSGVECLDLLNEVLEKDNYILVRHAGTFYLHPADQPVDPNEVDAVTADDVALRWEEADPDPAPGWGGVWDSVGRWVPRERTPARKLVPPKRGKTEIATLVIAAPSGSKLADFLPQIKKLLSRFGRLEECEGGKECRVTDRVDNLCIIEIIASDRIKPER